MTTEIKVRPGDVWLIGGCTLICDDLLQRLSLPDALREAASSEMAFAAMPKPVVAYVNPPWNVAQEKAYRSLAGGGESVVLDHSQLPATDIQRRVLRECELIETVFIEMGDEVLDPFIQLLNSEGWHTVAIWPMLYRGGRRSCQLLQITKGTRAEILSMGMRRDHEEAPEIVIAQMTKPGDLVYDPCFGRNGLTIRAAHKLGRRAMGIELVPEYVESVIHSLIAAGAGDPVLAWRKG